MYSKQVWPLGGFKGTNSFGEQTTEVLAKPVDKIAWIKYVKGLALYMKIQKPGNTSGPAKTPQKFKHMVNNNVAKLAALSANSLKAIHNWPMVPE